ncbi:MAG: class I SAM-dependent methyltransferase [Sulfuricurvum sp.]|jgi:hypothetical protein|uniref:class I SAM-dependent methyltransferase n=1 Tax=Sulfuricurvum sp. TaxID=2025608 RepID=UPI0025D11883|nr:class I SAM-dependent methyltransferase [Sulfuricurvum sp.]MCK9371992.1 class I SAM-dependent methyltransferase [Sulfuricurvum sp.]
MSTQREFWNERFGREGYFYGIHPNLYLKSHIDLLPSSRSLLFLGEGEGRNAIYAASLGHTVTALDASDIGLAKTAMLAKEQNLEVALIHTDLELWNPAEFYDAIMCSFLHLNEPLRTEVFEKAIASLNPAGVFVGEFFSIDQLPKTTGGPKDETLLYTAEELRSILESAPCSIIELYEMDTDLNEGRGHVGIASVVRMAVRT